MKLWCSLRYLVAQLTFLILRLPVSRFEREVSELWRLTPEERRKRLDATLNSIRPKGENGQSVCSIAQLVDQEPLTKSAFRERVSSTPKTAPGYARHTAGTTGDPTSIFLSREELARMLAVRSYCYRHHGIRLGQREARIWGRAENSFGSKIRNFLLNRKVFYPAESDVKDIVSDLVSWKPQYVYGYTSLILEAAQVIEKSGLKPKGVKAVICTAESILPAQKSFIARAFNSPVLEEYGSTEFDIIGFECKSGHLHLANPWLYIETKGGEGLITDVIRKCQNLVRYQIGDILDLRETDCHDLGSIEVIKELRGRTSNQFGYMGLNNKFHAVVFGRFFEKYMNDFDDCFSFQVAQSGFYNFNVFLSIMPRRGPEHLKNWLKCSFLEYFGNEFEEKVEFLIYPDRLKKGEKKLTYFSLEFEPD